MLEVIPALVPAAGAVVGGPMGAFVGSLVAPNVKRILSTPTMNGLLDEVAGASAQVDVPAETDYWGEIWGVVEDPLKRFAGTGADWLGGELFGGGSAPVQTVGPTPEEAKQLAAGYGSAIGGSMRPMATSSPWIKYALIGVAAFAAYKLLKK